MIEHPPGLSASAGQDEPGEMAEGDRPGEADQPPSAFEEGGQGAEGPAPVLGGAPVGGYELIEGPVPFHALRQQDQVAPALDAHLRSRDGFDAVSLSSFEKLR